MREITSELHQYRECVTQVWNRYFADTADADQHAYWSSACVELFRALVLWPIERDDYEIFPDQHDYKRKSVPFLNLVPVGICDILINAGIDRIGASWGWKAPTEVAAGEADLRFVWFWDWNVHTQRSFEFVMVKILESKKYPKAANRFALIRTVDARVFFEDTAG